MGLRGGRGGLFAVFFDELRCLFRSFTKVVVVVTGQTGEYFTFYRSRNFFVHILFTTNGCVGLPGKILGVPSVFGTPLSVHTCFRSLPGDIRSTVIRDSMDTSGLRRLGELTTKCTKNVCTTRRGWGYVQPS